MIQEPSKMGSWQGGLVRPDRCPTRSPLRPGSRNPLGGPDHRTADRKAPVDARLSAGGQGFRRHRSGPGEVLVRDGRRGLVGQGADGPM